MAKPEKVHVILTVELQVDQTRGRFAHENVRGIFQAIIKGYQQLHPNWKMTLTEKVIR